MLKISAIGSFSIILLLNYACLDPRKNSNASQEREQTQENRDNRNVSNNANSDNRSSGTDSNTDIISGENTLNNANNSNNSSAEISTNSGSAINNQGTNSNGSRNNNGEANNSGRSDSDLSSLQTLVGTWRGRCLPNDSDDDDFVRTFQIETLTFNADGSYQEQEEEFNDADCTRPRGGRRIVEIGNKVRVTQIVASDTFLISFQQMKEFDDETGRLEPDPESSMALVRIRGSRMTFDSNSTATSGFTQSAEIYDRR